MKVLGSLALLSLLLLVHLGQGEQAEGEEQEQEIITAHETWQEASQASESSLEDGGGSQESSSPPELLQFTAKDAVDPTDPHGIFSDPPTPPPAPEEDPEVTAARKAFETGLEMLGSSKGDKRAGWELVEQASEQGWRPASIKLAWAMVLGTEVNLDVHRSTKRDCKTTYFSPGPTTCSPACRRKEIRRLRWGWRSCTPRVLWSTPHSLRFESLHVFQSVLLHRLSSTTPLVPSVGLPGPRWPWVTGVWGVMEVFYLCVRYWSGMGVATSCEKALDYYR